MKLKKDGLIYREIYLDSTAREAETRFYAWDIGKLVLEQATMTAWIVIDVVAGKPAWQLAGFAPLIGIIPTGVIDGDNVTFVLPQPPISGLALYNGIRLNEGAGNDFTLGTDGVTITMATAPTVGVVIADIF